jgi:REP element-mobilizing transposase RayT
MKRQFYDFETFPLHVTGKLENLSWPTKTLSEAWEIISEIICDLQKEYDLHSHAFVMMRNHYHWICTYKDFADDDGLFEWFHEMIAVEFLHRTEHGHTLSFEGPPLIEELDHISAFRNAYRYVYRNPVTAGIVEKAEWYPFSSLPSVLGRGKLKFQCFDKMHLIQDPHKTLKFINSEHTEEFHFI